MSKLKVRSLETRNGITGEVLTGGAGPALVYLHSAFGVQPSDRLLNKLANHFTVYAPVWPGFGLNETETQIETMLDFTLHGWDLVDAMGLTKPIVVGHSMGAMIAAEMAATSPKDLSQLVLIAPTGLWIDQCPVPDIFAMLPYELATALFHDKEGGEQLLTAGRDFNDDEALAEFMVNRARQMGTAGKILFPIPNRGLAQRLYRVAARTSLLWGASDRLYPAVYRAEWRSLLPAASEVVIPDAGHMLPLERPSKLAKAIRISLS